MKIIEVIQQYGVSDSVPTYSNEASFTVNNAVDYVTAVYAGGVVVSDYYLKDGFGGSKFDVGDNFIINSVGISIPIGFSIYSNAVNIILRYKDSGTTENYLRSTKGFFGNFILPFDNYEMPVDMFFNCKNLSMYDGRIGINIVELDGTPLKIGMLNVPDDLNGKSYKVSAFMKITHNKGVGI
jgi:hypothetical protein